MKKYVFILAMLGLFLSIMHAEDTESSLGLSISKATNIYFGIVNSSLSISEAGGEKISPANGLQVGVSGVTDFLKLDGKQIIGYELGWSYTQRNYKVADWTVERNYLVMSNNLRHDLLGKGWVQPHIGFNTVWSLSGKDNKTWVNDIPLNIGITIEQFGIKYEYSHGTYAGKVFGDHKAKTNTHTFSWGVSF